MIRNGVWDLFPLSYPCNQVKNWDIILNLLIFPLGCVKHHIKSLKEGSEVDQYVIHNLKWSGNYMRSIFQMLFFGIQQQWYC